MIWSVAVTTVGVAPRQAAASVLDAAATGLCHARSRAFGEVEECEDEQAGVVVRSQVPRSVCPALLMTGREDIIFGKPRLGFLVVLFYS